MPVHSLFTLHAAREHIPISLLHCPDYGQWSRLMGIVRLMGIASEYLRKAIRCRVAHVTWLLWHLTCINLSITPRYNILPYTVKCHGHAMHWRMCTHTVCNTMHVHAKRCCVAMCKGTEKLCRSTEVTPRNTAVPLVLNATSCTIYGWLSAAIHDD